MEKPQPLGLLDVRLSLILRKKLPPPPQLLGDLGVVLVRVHLDDLPPLELRPDHEGVHRTLDVVRRVFLGLKTREIKAGH